MIVMARIMRKLNTLCDRACYVWRSGTHMNG